MIQVLLLLNYVISFYVIFHHISQNLLVLREQLSFIDNEDVHAMHDAVYTKYVMFKYVHISTCVFPFTCWLYDISNLIKRSLQYRLIFCMHV